MADPDLDNDPGALPDDPVTEPMDTNASPQAPSASDASSPDPEEAQPAAVADARRPTTADRALPTKRSIPVAVWALGGTVAAAALAGALLLLLRPSAHEGSALAGAQIDGDIPKLETDDMAPVGSVEASRRASANAVHATEAVVNGETSIAPPVIERTFPADGPEARALARALGSGEEDSQPEPEPVQATPPPSPPPPPAPPATSSAPARALPPEDFMQRVQAQIALADPRPRAFQIATFPKPPPPPAATPASASAGTGPSTSGMPGVGIAGTGRISVQPGDILYATLDQGFNSDDPKGLPIFATIRDPGRDGVAGPLDGARLMGQVSYSQSNAVITFQTLVARGRTVPVQAMAISESDARAGIAKDVDNHTIERYAALFGASLLQGAGEVGQLLVDQSRNFDYYPDLGAYRSRGTDINWTAAGMGVLRPVGDELTSATKSGFSQPPTITSPSGMGIGVIFTQPLAL
ncbi:MAG: DotG/IcmE/VirB10 family protein [Inquilinus sp.]|uniref:DotG/IcmE/VirB10 family protein n=1 Tax=Inquilinus sp. TaxID=1932117 RepID=UPI003F3C62B8